MLSYSFSIAVCTHNPLSDLLERLLNSISKLKYIDEVLEILIIDNNSSLQLTEIPIVQDFLANHPNADLVQESKAGLKWARIRAINNTNSNLLVFFDDDNEPQNNYLEILDKYFVNYPNVGVWGPGHVEVIYTDSVNFWLQKHPELFQHRREDFGYSCLPSTWNSYCPNGTGFCVRRKVLERYAEQVNSGKLTVTGRIGKSLSSAEDVQIVWEGFKLGFAAGLIPELSCNHLIPSFKANISYLKKQTFGAAASYLPALIQSYPDCKEAVYALNDNDALILIKGIIKAFLIWLDILQIFDVRTASLRLANSLGSTYSKLKAIDSNYASLVLNFSKLLNMI
ncbi:MAG: glycosyltransferase [Cyanobacteria bacterium P01_C01_bin.120]